MRAVPGGPNYFDEIRVDPVKVSFVGAYLPGITTERVNHAVRKECISSIPNGGPATGYDACVP